jgi:hypothetical protein
VYATAIPNVDIKFPLHISSSPSPSLFSPLHTQKKKNQKQKLPKSGKANYEIVFLFSSLFTFKNTINKTI